MPRSVYHSLPVPELAELKGAPISEWFAYTQNAAMTGGQIVWTAIGVVCGFWLAFSLDQALLSLVPIAGGWWLGRLLSPPRETRAMARRLREADFRVCPKCEYSLKGLAEAGKCPECGSDYTLAQVREHWERVTE